MAANTADGLLGVVVGTSQVAGGRRKEAGELLLVEVASNAEAVVALLGCQGNQEDTQDQRRPRQQPDPLEETADDSQRGPPASLSEP